MWSQTTLRVGSQTGNLDYDQLTILELTMGILARSSRAAKGVSNKGYVSEFLDLVLAPYLDLILKKGVKIVTNAGGLDPEGLKDAIEAHLKKRGLEHAFKVAAVFGDDLVPHQGKLHQSGVFEAFDPLNGFGPKDPYGTHDEGLLSLNAYLGGQPITEALKDGANIVVTGRCVDSALVVGPLAYEFGWDYSFNPQALDRLASASLAGHIIECGAQATGGNYTDWKNSAFSSYGGWSNMGYPILTFNQDNSFTITKPENTGGIVDRFSVCEQMLYEVLDTANYLLPDVVLDMRDVAIQQVRPGVVAVKGAKGKPPTPWLKCTAVKQQGFRISADILVCGEEAESKAEVLGQAILDRTNAISTKRHNNQFPPIAREDCEIILIGAERSVDPSCRSSERREVVLRVGASHSTRAVLDILGKEVAPFLTNSCPGICLLTSGRPKCSPNFAANSVLIRREAVVAKVVVGNRKDLISVPFSTQGCREVTPSEPSSQINAIRNSPMKLPALSSLRTKLCAIAVGRSGDKGDSANVAIIARDPEFYPYILEQVTSEVVYAAFKHFIARGGSVTRFEVPGVQAVNFVLTKALGGGGLSSLRLDR